MSEMARTTKKRGKGKSKRKGKRDLAKVGDSVAAKREAEKAAGRKGPTNGVLEGSLGSCRRHAKPEKQPGQRLTHSLSSEISDSGNETEKQRIGSYTRWETTNEKKEKGAASS